MLVISRSSDLPYKHSSRDRNLEGDVVYKSGGEEASFKIGDART